MKSEKNNVPLWQQEIISNVISALRAYYCLFDEGKLKQLEADLTKAVYAYNISLQVLAPPKPTSEMDYQPYLEVLNSVLEEFDSHCHLAYAHDFLAEHKPSEIIKDDKSARLNLGYPPLHVLEQMNTFRGRPDQNYGFSNIPPTNVVLPADVGYLKMNYSLDSHLGEDQKDDKYRVGPHAIEAATHALAKLQGKKRIIIDLRNVEEGGSPEMIQFIISFFMEKTGVVINKVVDRLAGTERSFETVETPFKLLDVPVDILVDQTTFSALEELAYDLQQFGIADHRFCVIGETTKGGAHPTFSFPLMNTTDQSINPDLILWIPCQRSINPISGTNWEKVGVAPNIEIQPGEDALQIALFRHSGKCVYHGSVTKLLMQNNVLFRKLEDKHLEEHRHDDPRLQREYDKRFGLVPKR